MATATRTFEDKAATREQTPLLVGLVGPSGSGKTYSALRLATGIQRVTGGEVYFIDTEARRALHYADQFKFRHLEFKAPFGPLDYLAAVEHCVRKGAKTIVIDSVSHEHEGPGGVLEMHAAEVDRLSRGDESKADRVKMLAWQRPKSERRRLLNTLLQIPANFLFCFRAKEKIKVVAGKNPVQLGWMPIAGEEFVYEMSLNCLLYPAGNGVPVWKPAEEGEKAMIKLPMQFREVFARAEPLSEEIGERLARWAAGDGSAAASLVARWDQAVAAYAALGVGEARLLAALGADEASRVDANDLASLRDSLKAIKAGRATADGLFPPLAEDVPQRPPVEPEDVSQEPDEDTEPWDDGVAADG
jgi:energy-coupling factor transporter ATP-binding protein EcfA2